ncbi:MAG: hypothetical protein ACKOJI_02255, partial [Phycisphaerales bacterium]
MMSAAAVAALGLHFAPPESGTRPAPPAPAAAPSAPAGLSRANADAAVKAALKSMQKSQRAAAAMHRDPERAQLVAGHAAELACPDPHLRACGGDDARLQLGGTIGALQRSEALAPGGRHGVSVERGVERAHLDRERQVAQPVRHGLVRVPGHHRRGREAVGHARRQL